MRRLDGFEQGELARAPRGGAARLARVEQMALVDDEPVEDHALDVDGQLRVRRRDEDVDVAEGLRRHLLGRDAVEHLDGEARCEAARLIEPLADECSTTTRVV